MDCSYFTSTVVYTMDGSFPSGSQGAIGNVCQESGTQFPMSYRFDQHWRSAGKLLASFNNHDKACNIKAGFEPRTLGTKTERYDHCATRPVAKCGTPCHADDVG
jgi:hypothetical protein